MAPWLKWLLGSVVTFLTSAGILVSLAIFALYRLTDDMCAARIPDATLSPDGKAQAVLFEIDCGATTGFNRHVAITSSDTDLRKRNPAIQTSFFSAAGEPEIRMNWVNSQHLEVRYPKNAKVFRIESKSEGVAIEYKKYR